MHKVIIAGGRKFENYLLLKLKCDFILHRIAKDKQQIQIVSGGGTGADALGERYAKERGYIVKRFEALWAENGIAAGPIRNQQMAEYATHLIAFWDGQSKGTKNMIDQARKLNLKIKIVSYA